MKVTTFSAFSQGTFFGGGGEGEGKYENAGFPYVKRENEKRFLSHERYVQFVPTTI